MKIKEIVNAYNVLGEVSVYNLEDSEIIKILKARIEMKQYVDKYNMFLEEAKEKFKPSDYDQKSALIAEWHTLDENVRKGLNQWIKQYDDKINSAIKDYSEQEVEITVEKLDSASAVKILKNNNWQPNKLDNISFML